MSRFYTVEFENVAVTAAQDFFEISPASNKPCIIRCIDVAQYSDVGDAASEILRWRLIRGYTVSGSGGSAPTPQKVDPAYGTVGFAAEVNNTTIANTGTAAVLWSSTFNIATGLFWLPPPEFTFQVVNGELMVVRLMAAPADSLSMSGTIVVEEL